MFGFFKKCIAFIFCLVAFQLGQADWLQELKDVNTQRAVLFKEQQPGFVIRPLSNKASAIVGGSRYGIDYKRSATLKEREVLYKSLMQTASMHQRTHFFEQPYALYPKSRMTVIMVI